MIIASIDKHPIIRKGLGLFLQEQFENIVLLEAENYESYVRLFSNERPDLFIIGFAEESNIHESETVSFVKEKMPNIPVIVYDGEPRYEMAVYSLVAGASSYLVKNSCPTELVKCIESVMQGKRYMSEDVADILLKQCMNASKENERNATLNNENTAIHNSGIPSINPQKLSVYNKLELKNIMELSNLFLS